MMGRRDAGGLMGRRGLLGGAAALVAGGLAKLARPERAEAAHSGSDPAFIHAGASNTTTAMTVISATLTDRPTLVVSNHIPVSIGTPDAIQAATAAGGTSAAVRGTAYGSAGETAGVNGSTGSPTTNASGVKGSAFEGATNGVWGNNSSPATNATGVYGLAGAPTANATVGVWGRTAGSTSTGAVGTFGQSANGSGVRGESTSGNGMLGVSTNASGVYGFSNFSFGAAGVSNVGVGVYAKSNSNWGLHAESPVFAGVFSGAVYINGSYTATGAKSAAVKNKRGEHRRMYCQEAPEAWFEDFGEATLANGRAEVPLDPEFDEVVKGDDYRVFLTEVGDCGGLYISRQAPHRFEVRSRGGDAARGSFHYRVVARRLDDVGRRLEKVDVPDFSKVTRPVPPSDLPPAPSRLNRPGR